METTSATSVLNLVKANTGATVQPYPLIQQINDPELICVPIVEETPYRSLEILYRSDRYLGLAAKAFMDRIVSFFSN